MLMPFFARKMRDAAGARRRRAIVKLHARSRVPRWRLCARAIAIRAVGR
jgi:hypothetical protein